MTRESRPSSTAEAAQISSPASDTISSSVTRRDVEALLLELAASRTRPRWYAYPTCEAEFAASVLVHCEERGRKVALVFDAGDKLVGYQGLRARRSVA